ncbi:MAG: endonuclease/exonuclease/phosphatase family protein [Myxococcales bacterium]
MPPSTRRRTAMRVWFALSALLFFARCADQIRPYVKSIVGAKDQKPAAAADAPATKLGPLSVRVASWNLEWLDEPGRGPKPRDRRDYQALAQIAKQLDADVIAVQEVASDLALALVFPPERYAYHLANRGGSQRSGFVYKRSLNTVSHPDLDSLAGQHLRAGADLGIKIGEQELRLLSVHLKAFCATGPLDSTDKDCQQLKAQLPALEGWVDSRAREGGAFAVIGDFNRAMSDAGDEVLRDLDDGEPQSLKLSQATPARRAACTKESHQAVDHILLGGPATGWLTPGSFLELPSAASNASEHVKLSDHCPLVVELRLPPG